MNKMNGYNQKQPPEVFFEIDVLKNFVIFTENTHGKTLHVLQHHRRRDKSDI